MTPESQQSVGKLFRVEYQHLCSTWGCVLATNKGEAIAKAKLGQFVENSVDSDPGADVWNRVRAFELKNGVAI